MDMKSNPQLRLCTCTLAGCGSKETWCSSQGKFISGHWISKAVHSRHRHADKIWGAMLGTDPQASDETVPMDSLLGHGYVSSEELEQMIPSAETHTNDGEGIQMDHAPEASFPEPSDYDHASCVTPTEDILYLEEALHDLQHISTLLSQISGSLMSKPGQKFQSLPSKHIPYVLFTCIPLGPNMGSQRLDTGAPMNAQLLTQEAELYRLLVALRGLSFPNNTRLTDCCGALLGRVEEALFEVDCIRAAAWEAGRLSGSVDDARTCPEGVVTVNTESYFLRDKRDTHPAIIACYMLVLTLNLFCGLSQAHTGFVTTALRFIMQRLLHQSGLSTEDKCLLVNFPRDP
ncbi:hypothetical protein BKA82DRAFT_541901 [Pisolithus tinctorius]|nr:hypothetical protein BKA82DRAFT_541901 [Pisolithus tinctorius]